MAWFLKGHGPVLLRNPIFLCFFTGSEISARPPLDPRKVTLSEICSLGQVKFSLFISVLIPLIRHLGHIHLLLRHPCCVSFIFDFLAAIIAGNV